MAYSKIFKKVFLLILRLIGYWEVLILFGIQLFWIIYRGEALHHENTIELLMLIGPILITIMIGGFVRYESFKIIIKSLEWLFHSLTTIFGIFLLLLILIRDELNPFIPFTWSFYVWLIFFGLVLISNISMNLGKKSLLTSFNDNNTSFFFGGWIASWLIMLGLISIMRYPVSYWIFACIFHSIMIPISFDGRNRKIDSFNQPKNKGASLYIYKMFKEIFLIFLMIFAWNQWGFELHTLGAIEDNYNLILGFFITPLFYIGILLSFFLLFIESRKHIKVSISGDILGLIIAGLSLFNFHSFAPIAFGYALVSLLFHLSTSPPIRYSISISLIPIGWWISLTLFAFNGFMFDMGYLINFILFLLLLILFIISISFFGMFNIGKYLNKRKGGSK